MTEDEAARAIDRYCACWRVMGAGERLAELRGVVAPNVRYVDPRSEAVGIEALGPHIASVAAARPGAVIERTSRVDLHHEFARFAWRLRDGGEIAMDGSIDVVAFDRDGKRLATIIGFFGPVRPMTDEPATGMTA